MEWKQRFGAARCHLLKIDIEGSELNFLQAEQSFLPLVDAILIEWHKWRVGLDAVREFLARHEFAYVKTVEENEHMGTAFFGRPTR
jgi:hypothetical protein